MYKPIQMSRTLLNGLAHIIIAVQVEDISHKVQRILVVLNLGVESREVEAIGEVVFVDLAEVLVAAGGDELGMSALCQGRVTASRRSSTGGRGLTQSRQ